MLCLAIAAWALQPPPQHVPTPLETIQDHLLMIAEHGHSHGFEEDLRWALHGHAHSIADHDHNPVSLVETAPVPITLALRAATWPRGAPAHSRRPFLLERPPRA